MFKKMNIVILSHCVHEPSPFGNTYEDKYLEITFYQTSFRLYLFIEKTVKSVPTVPGKGQQGWIQAGFSRTTPTM